MAPTSPAPDAPRFLRACRRETVDVTPVWLMRQAGRTIPAYRKLRAGIGFLDLCKRPDLMAEVTAMPLDVYDVDAAVLFADIMLPLAALGVDFEIAEGVGPVVAEPLRTCEQIDRLERIDVAEAVPAVFEAVKLATAQIDVPVIGFAGAPFTLACYLVEGRPSREFTRPKALMFSDPPAWHTLMGALTDVCVDYLNAQVAAGAHAVQLFDSWVGSLAPSDFEAFAAPYVRRIFDEVRGVPRIYFGTNTATLLGAIATTGCDVVGVDWRIGLADAWQAVGPDRAIQGNLDPSVLLGSKEAIRERTHAVLRAADGRPGHVFNLGHGVLPDTPQDAIRMLVDTVHGQ